MSNLVNMDVLRGIIREEIRNVLKEERSSKSSVQSYIAKNKLINEMVSKKPSVAKTHIPKVSNPLGITVYNVTTPTNKVVQAVTLKIDTYEVFMEYGGTIEEFDRLIDIYLNSMEELPINLTSKQLDEILQEKELMVFSKTRIDGIKYCNCDCDDCNMTSSSNNLDPDGDLISFLGKFGTVKEIPSNIDFIGFLKELLDECEED